MVTLTRVVAMALFQSTIKFFFSKEHITSQTEETQTNKNASNYPKQTITKAEKTYKKITTTSTTIYLPTRSHFFLIGFK